MMTGCTAPATPAPSTPTLAASANSAEETCDELSDVLTALFNSRTAETQGRTVENEVSGAHDLAARMMARVAVEPDTDLADAVGAWSTLIVAPNSTFAKQSFDPDSTEWNSRQRDVASACEAAGAELFVSSWTGG